MKEVEVILEEVVFKVGPVVILGEMLVGTEVERIEGLGDSLDQEKEEWELGQNQAPDLDQIQGLVENRDREDSDRESDGARSASLQILADSDMGLEVEQYLNIWKVGMVPPHFCL